MRTYVYIYTYIDIYVLYMQYKFTVHMLNIYRNMGVYIQYAHVYIYICIHNKYMYVHIYACIYAHHEPKCFQLDLRNPEPPTAAKPTSSAAPRGEL